MGRCGFPATTASMPVAATTAARIAPPPGIGPSGVGYDESALVASKRAPRQTAARRDPQPLVVEVEVEAHHHRIGVAIAHGHGAPLLERLHHPRPCAHEHALAWIHE